MCIRDSMDDDYLVGAGSPFQTADYAPALANDTDGDGDKLLSLIHISEPTRPY